MVVIIRSGRNLALLIAALAVALAIGASGCSSTRNAGDSRIERDADAGRTAFAEGMDERAIERYREAVRRAWALDDAEAIGRNSYNLAACLAATGYYVEARDWLAEARAGLRRAKDSIVETWLLEARVARLQGHVEEAVAYTELAARLRQKKLDETSVELAVYCPDPMLAEVDTLGLASEPPAQRQDKTHPYRPKLIATKQGVFDFVRKWTPGLTSDEEEMRVRRRISADAQVHLLRADIACDLGDLELAAEELDAARALLVLTVDPGLNAEHQRVSGRRLMLLGAPLAAGVKFDREAGFLRAAENYREIAPAYASAGEAYELGTRFDLAADRYQRAARMLYARNEILAALTIVEHAVPLAQMSGAYDVESRLAALFYEIALVIQEEEDETSYEDESTSDGNRSEPEPEFVPPAEVLHEPVPAPERGELPAPIEPQLKDFGPGGVYQRRLPLAPRGVDDTPRVLPREKFEGETMRPLREIPESGAGGLPPAWTEPPRGAPFEPLNGRTPRANPSTQGPEFPLGGRVFRDRPHVPTVPRPRLAAAALGPVKKRGTQGYTDLHRKYRDLPIYAVGPIRSAAPEATPAPSPAESTPAVSERMWTTELRSGLLRR